MRSFPLNKKDLINEVYWRIAEKIELYDIYGVNERIIENFIHLYMYYEKENMCKVCYKPNWEKLAGILDIEVEMEFIGRYCSICKEHNKPQHVYSTLKDKWTIINKKNEKNK